MGAAWSPESGVRLGWPPGFPETEQAWGAFPAPRPEGLSFLSPLCLVPSACQQPLERNTQQVGDGPHQSQGSQGSSTTKLEFQIGEVKWSRVEGANIGKQGREAHSKLNGLAIIKQSTYLASLWVISPKS